jgi:hypothetical protein
VLVNSFDHCEKRRRRERKGDREEEITVINRSTHLSRAFLASFDCIPPLIVHLTLLLRYPNCDLKRRESEEGLEG